jgi:hypothetical protein
MEYVLQVLDWSGVVSARIDSVTALVDGSSFTITGVFGSSPTVTHGGNAVTVNSSNSTTIGCTASVGTKKYGQPYTLTVTDSVGGTASVDVSIAPDANTRYIDLVAPLLSSTLGIEADIPLAGGDQIRWRDSTVLGTSVDVDDVEAFPNRAFRFHIGVESVEFQANDGTGYAAALGPQTLELPTDPPVVSTIPVIRYQVGFPFQVSLGIYATGWESIDIDGDLPPGLSITDGVISGTPTAEGAYRIVADFTNESGTTPSNSFVLTSGSASVRNMTTSQARRRLLQ